MTHAEGEDTMTEGQRKTQAAREARARNYILRKSDEWAEKLRSVGWTCTPPDAERYPDDRPV